MNYGKIVGVYGSNISISVQIGDELTYDGRENIQHHAEVMLPAGAPVDVDYAVARIGDAVGFSTCGGKIWFPEKSWPTPTETKSYLELGRVNTSKTVASK